MITQKEINRYIKDIKKQLLYGSKQSREFLAGLRQNVCDFASENENADIAAVKEQFGKPEDIAATFFEQYEKNEIKRKVNVRRVIVAASITVVLMIATTLIVGIVDSFNSKLSYHIDTIYEETTHVFVDINSTDVQS